MPSRPPSRAQPTLPVSTSACALSRRCAGRSQPTCSDGNLTPMDILGYSVVAVVVVAVIIGVVRGGRIQEQRRAHLQQWGDQHGWSYAADDSQLTRQWREYPVRAGGRATQVLRGSVAEGEIVSFTNYRAHAGSSTAGLYLEIGRASCRERVGSRDGAQVI